MKKAAVVEDDDDDVFYDSNEEQSDADDDAEDEECAEKGFDFHAWDGGRPPPRGLNYRRAGRLRGARPKCPSPAFRRHR